MGAQMQRRAYSRVCGASTAKRPAALGHAGPGPPPFPCPQAPTATNPIDPSPRIADSAFPSGVTADLSIPYTLIGSVDGVGGGGDLGAEKMSGSCPRIAQRSWAFRR